MTNTDWANPNLATPYTSFLDDLKNRDEDLACWLDSDIVTTSSNLPNNLKRYNATSGSFEESSNAGSTWNDLNIAALKTTSSQFTHTVTGTAWTVSHEDGGGPTLTELSVSAGALGLTSYHNTGIFDIAADVGNSNASSYAQLRLLVDNALKGSVRADADGDINLFNASDQGLTIDSSGNAAFSGNLDLTSASSGATQFSINNTDTGSNGNWAFNVAGSSNGLGIAAGHMYISSAGTANDFIIRTQSNEATETFRILGSNGNSGFGVASPTERLSVNGKIAFEDATYAKQALIESVSTGGGSHDMVFSTRSGGSESENWRITSGGLLRGQSNGSESNPAISGGNDSNTGIYFDGGDQLFITTGGSRAAYFSNGQEFLLDGKIGVNGGTPGANAAIGIGLSTEDLEVIDAGSTGATEQDWIEVEVGGNQGFIRVHSTK